ncbi:nucleotide-diphospho-sugar transferase [Pedobacter duraquae]|uniref:Nucleotide-diphospho-sugar transferase n=1 Tax=Pedobacter duraquae TaxID=425511 RepID=A0A4R6ILZ7_9SPHI|nr:nucleotide-diphospho-sugar transferase [Pedobacter duraquae]TDO23142.1 hypothetical protein CLV32_2129 [Pedobacter duraquae]
MSYNTPVLFLVFNRPEQTAIVFAEIRKQKPTQLYIAADGPRAGNETDKLRCAEVREIVKLIDWECTVELRFNEHNVGTKYAVSTAINWFFEHVESGIILEDDCLPNESFFEFSAEMLERYQSNAKVMMINGCSFQPKPLDTNDYYFSKYVHVWGWATWRRAWDLYHIELTGISSEQFEHVVSSTFSQKRERQRWIQNFHLIQNGFDTWDYQWMFWIWKNKGLSITPWHNLISNIGFGKDATHTLDENSGQSKMAQHHLKISSHPHSVFEHKKADALERYQIIISPSREFRWQQIKGIIRRLIRNGNGAKA